MKRFFSSLGAFRSFFHLFVCVFMGASSHLPTVNQHNKKLLATSQTPNFGMFVGNIITITTIFTSDLTLSNRAYVIQVASKLLPLYTSHGCQFFEKAENPRPTPHLPDSRRFSPPFFQAVLLTSHIPYNFRLRLRLGLFIAGPTADAADAAAGRRNNAMSTSVLTVLTQANGEPRRK